jgi:methionyl-tRNA formyltransferase
LNNIDIFIGNPRNITSIDFVKNKFIEVLISINYLYLIENYLINHPSKLAFNIHGSLLPKYRGRTPHIWAIINNEKKTGITAHLIDDGCDTGEVIEQLDILIGSDETGSDILKKFEIEYIPLLSRVLDKIENDELILIKQDCSRATYFGKRAPEDGRIDWNWTKERINNWIRALSNPYPGAFAFYNKQCLIIDKIAYSDQGFNYNDQNGLIISISPLIVKTTNGAIQIIQSRTEIKDFQLNTILE